MDCARCDSTGWEPVIVNGVRRVTRCQCWLDQHPSHVVGIPVFFARATLASFEPRRGTEAALAAAKRWLKGSHDLYLGGPVGSGKSRLACSLANESRGAGITAAFFDIADLLERARRDDFGDDDDRRPAASALSIARAADILVLDDVGGAEKASDYTLRTLLSLYNHRLAEQRRTIWTSNQQLDRIGEILGDDRLPSRIAGAAEIVWVPAADYRVHGPKAWEADVDRHAPAGDRA